MIFAALDRFRPPESVRIHADDALNSLNLFSFHRVIKASPRTMNETRIIPMAIMFGFIILRLLLLFFQAF